MAHIWVLAEGRLNKCGHCWADIPAGGKMLEIRLSGVDKVRYRCEPCGATYGPVNHAQLAVAQDRAEEREEREALADTRTLRAGPESSGFTRIGVLPFDPKARKLRY